MHQNRINESSNMLHYSNASSIEENRRYLVIKGGGLAWLLRQGGVVGDVVVLGGISVGLVVYRREEGEEIMNTKQTKHHKIYQGNTRCSVCPNAVVGDTGEGGKTSGKVFPVFRVFGQRSRRGKVAGSIG